jgi:hypothetical protein
MFPQSVPIDTPDSELLKLLRPQTYLHPAALWRPFGGTGFTIADADHLIDLISMLAIDGDWAVAERGSSWAQAMRVPLGWIVEVNGEPGPECFARRVRPAGLSEHPTHDQLGAWSLDGLQRATYTPSEGVASAPVAAALIWGWLHGELLEGYTLRQLEVGD